MNWKVSHVICFNVAHNVDSLSFLTTDIAYSCFSMYANTLVSFIENFTFFHSALWCSTTKALLITNSTITIVAYTRRLTSFTCGASDSATGSLQRSEMQWVPTYKKCSVIQGNLILQYTAESVVPSVKLILTAAVLHEILLCELWL